MAVFVADAKQHRQSVTWKQQRREAWHDEPLIVPNRIHSYCVANAKQHHSIAKVVEVPGTRNPSRGQILCKL